jgi:hypothetical protein
MVYHKTIKHRHGFNRDNPNSEHGDRFYYWIWFARDSSHKGLLGSYQTYEQAERKAVSSLNVPYEIVKLRTRDEAEASRVMRARLLGDSGDVEKTFNRFSHKE